MCVREFKCVCHISSTKYRCVLVPKYQCALIRIWKIFWLVLHFICKGPFMLLFPLMTDWLFSCLASRRIESASCWRVSCTTWDMGLLATCMSSFVSSHEQSVASTRCVRHGTSICTTQTRMSVEPYTCRNSRKHTQTCLHRDVHGHPSQHLNACMRVWLSAWIFTGAHTQQARVRGHNMTVFQQSTSSTTVQHIDHIYIYIHIYIFTYTHTKIHLAC